MKTVDRLLAEIEARVRSTICLTFKSELGYRVETVEGRITEDDFNTLVALARRGMGGERLEPEAVAEMWARVNRATGGTGGLKR